MSRTRSLAAAQTIPDPGDLEANLDQHLELARVAAAEGAGIVVFPELSLTGYELDLASELALSEDDPRLEPLLESARSSAIALIVGPRCGSAPGSTSGPSSCRRTGPSSSIRSAGSARSRTT